MDKLVQYHHLFSPMLASLLMKHRPRLFVFPFLIFAGISFASTMALAADTAPVTMTFSTPEQCNVFSDTAPKVTIAIKNSKPGALTGTGTFTVTDQDGTQATTWTEQLNVAGTVTLQHDIPAPRYGLYTLAGALTFSDGTKLNGTVSLAKVPAQKELTAEEKMASPYGINFHSADDPAWLPAFKKAGIYWYRSYAFNLNDMDAHKGADHHYNEKRQWQSRTFADLFQAYTNNGLVLVPNLLALHRPANGHPGPSDEWAAKVHDLVEGVPSVKYWEIDNEFEINEGKGMGNTPEVVQNYELYHKKFGEVINALGDGRVAVENGRSEINLGPVKGYIASGDFDNIGVINSHHYTGADPPEVNFYNYNTGDHADENAGGNFFDTLREMKAVSQSDGKKRQSWLSEFGWDTVAGPMVSMEEQAFYLQRAYLLLIASGTDKGFWFYNFDIYNPKVPFPGYFAGCGLFTPFSPAKGPEPKLSLSAMAGMTSILPAPVYVGSINAGPNTAGYVFENEGKLVAGLWAIKGTGPHVTFHAKQLKDYLGNNMDGLSADLKMAPVYAIDLDKSDLYYRQTAYDLDTPHRVNGTAGDRIEPVLVVKNNREQPIKTTVKLVLPTGWTADKPEITVSVAPGKEEKVHFPYTINSDEKAGPQNIVMSCQEDNETVKDVTTTVAVRRPVEIHVASLSGAPGPTSVPVTLINHTTNPQNGTLTVKVPQGWQAPAPSSVTVPASGKQETKVDVTWNADWKEGETASVSFQPDKSKMAEEASIIPDEYHLNQAKGITLDGTLDDWPKEDQWPEWMLGSTAGSANTKLWLAWSPEGLYGAVEVHDSKGRGADPKLFWYDDLLELFLSSSSSDSPDQKAAPHFWLVPQFKDNRVYVGQWINANGKDASHYDMPIKSAARQTSDGYVMEFLLPASMFPNITFALGSTLKLNANLTVMGNSGNREVYWPRNKASKSPPQDWGLLKLN